MPFPFFKQLDSSDCGPTCLRIVASFYGKKFSTELLRNRSFITREGVNMEGICNAAESIGFRTIGVKINFKQLSEEAVLPAIVHWNQNHFVVVYKISKKKGVESIFVADPAGGLITMTKSEFMRCWASTREEEENIGFALLLEPTPDFYLSKGEKINKKSFHFLFSYLKSSHKLITQLILGLILGSLLQLIFPFLTQSVVDKGIGTRNIGFIYLVLLAQLFLTLSRVSVEFIRGWILLHISTRINVSLISDFLIKLMSLPISFFDAKMIGDLMQRIGDNKRIETFLTSTTLNVLFSLVNLIIFGIVLLYYNLLIFIIFLSGSIIYTLWIWLFMTKRKVLDNLHFSQMSANQSSLIQLIQGMQEIKLNSCEQKKRWEWERIQARLFKISEKGLALAQYQQSGGVLINEVKNIFISILAAKSVIDGNMTLGMMLAVQYIIGQMNSPIDQLINFINLTQDAKISLDRLGEIHLKEDEEASNDLRDSKIPDDKSIEIKDLSFRYERTNYEFVLDSINISIPVGKQIAIVGTSGSGKTTLMKLLLGFYPLETGQIKLGEKCLSEYSLRSWREKCGVVMQDGFIFSDTIANNIAPGAEVINKKKLLEATRIANIDKFIETLPLGFNTKIGGEGHGLSQGQKQRILIARAVYKDPKYIFFDEATNSLDSNNERIIMENLQNFFSGRTVLIIAHRLSTVKNANQIVVLNAGRIIETGTHEELSNMRGAYYTLVKNQLEL